MFRNLARSVQDIVYEQKTISNRSHLRITLIAFTPVRKINVRLSRRHATEGVSPSHCRLRRCPAHPELSERRLISSHSFPPVSRRATTTCGPAFRVRRFQ